MEFLYVCLFSSGHIKVGRSIDPASRIATHADRVACVGVDLAAHAYYECAGDALPREQLLIAKCVAAASRRLQSEWFEGLAYDTACGWAEACAKNETVSGKRNAGVDRAAAIVGSQSKLAEILSVPQACVSQWATLVRRVPVGACIGIEVATRERGEPVYVEELRSDVAWEVLRGSRPAVPSQERGREI